MYTVGSVHMHTHKHTYTCTQAHTIIIVVVVVKLIFLKSEIKINNKYSICIETVTDKRIQEK